MSEPLPEHVKRKEAAKVLRLSVRQIDRLADAGKLKKTKLSAGRSGFEHEDFDRYRRSIGAGEGYTSLISALTISLSIETLRALIELDRSLWLIRGTYQKSRDFDVAEWAVKHRVDLDIPLKALEKAIRCQRCGAHSRKGLGPCAIESPIPKCSSM